MSIVDDVQQALDAHRAGNALDADLVRALLNAVASLTTVPLVRVVADAASRKFKYGSSADFDTLFADPLRDALNNLARQVRPSPSPEERAATTQSREASRAIRDNALAAARADILAQFRLDSPAQSREDLLAVVSNQRQGDRAIVDLLRDGTIAACELDRYVLSDPSAKPASLPDPDDDRIHHWLDDHEGEDPEGDAIIRVIRARLWGDATPPSPSTLWHACGNATQKSLRIGASPLRYVGGKSKVLNKILNYFPREIDEYREPFLGGGSVALAVSESHPQASIWVNDANPAVWAFWLALRDHPDALINELMRARLSCKTDADARHHFDECKKALSKGAGDIVDTAAWFYAVNRLSFSGLGEHGSYAPTSNSVHWREEKIQQLEHYSRQIQHWKISNSDYREVLTSPVSGRHPLFYLDPPYEIPWRLYYRHRQFDHDAFANAAREQPSPILISYNRSEQIRSRFPEWHARAIETTYTCATSSGSGSRCTEYLLTNYQPSFEIEM
ncbi:DNA adenine methylase Dam [Rhodobacter viridis]|uniref:site-specific DNA-methyltransferase (adenine-specific) n=1 Tax=Rhodobacter viridis TaxID=1054202 RepID=A0A318TYI5_9RHOB|nr:DNA adenine methylase [Rhodobacter viridis]PYF08068.1 DNA adenine methylase Dam [Rhodobacter viridis]